MKRITKGEMIKRVHEIVEGFVTVSVPKGCFMDILDDYSFSFEDWIAEHIKQEYEYMSAFSVFAAARDLAFDGINNDREKKDETDGFW